MAPLTATVLEEGNAVVVEAGGPPSKVSDISAPWVVRSRRRVVLVVALLLVALVHTARVVGVYEYLQLPLNEPHAESSDAASPLTPDRPVECEKLDKSHIDPGFFHTDTCLTRAQMLEIIKELVFTAAAAFEAHNVTYFLDSGTLLGAFRAQKVIPHDVDADVGIDPAGLEYLRHNAVALPEKYHFTVWNSKLYPGSDRDDKLPARLIHKQSGLYVDVFAFLDWKDPKTGAAKVGPLPSWCFYNCVSCPKVASGGKALKVDPDWIYPVVNCTFEGVATMKCPHKTEQYLRYTFGKDFMTPKKYTRRLAPQLA